MRLTNSVVILWLSLACLGGVAGQVITAQALEQSQSVSGAASPASVDPNKASSEFNHHIAGWVLMVAGLLILVSLLSPDLRALRNVWPALFLLAGLFLALWSDAEIWPRGNLSWGWLLHHDREAGQHKIYALLLIVMGIVEYRASSFRSRFWRAGAFPILAVVGAMFLLVHDHSGSSGANSPEASAYLINPALDPDGNPRAPHASDPSPGSDHSMAGMSHMSMPMASTSMDHSSMPMGLEPSPTDAPSHSHHDHMTPAMLLVEREHFWFMIVGFGVALFKLISDSEFWRRRFVPYVWPSGVVLLGILLILYRE